MRLKKKDKDTTELTNITEGELWVIYWALKAFQNRGTSSNVAIDLADTIYNCKLIDVDPGYNLEVDKDAIMRKNQAILKTLGNMIPIQPAGISPSRGF